ncbi:MAG TPA: metallophosphoesterase [Anaerolineales bacterium]|nr:metallophosphoesterase [Anaerolineales bacterium]
MLERSKLTRRDFLKLWKAGAINLAALALGGLGYTVLVGPGQLTIETVQLKLPRLSRAFSGLRLVQISDIHMGSWMNLERFQRVVDLALAQKPDLLVITGDFLFGHNFNEASKGDLNDLITVLLPVAAILPSFAVLGNHDYWTNSEAVREMLRASQITELTNTVFTLTRSGENLHLCGVDDVWEGNVQLENVLSQLPDEGAAILLAHEPDFADTSAATGRFDLQVSGHSHGGQVVIPYYGPPILPLLGRKYPNGLYKVGKMFQYTNRGVGTGALPVRFNCPPEITLFILDGQL